MMLTLGLPVSMQPRTFQTAQTYSAYTGGRKSSTRTWSRGLGRRRSANFLCVPQEPESNPDLAAYVGKLAG